ncbi:MAG: ATP-dependent DNA helicase [Deltaproteobacteria bacterium]|nr:ATP-dependent DNA helicase [Deltaproteobacteria bacterium]
MNFTSLTIDKILGKEGEISRCLRDFEYRPAQIEMARFIDEALALKKQIIIEAGTGVGKTMGYLVPVILSQKKSVISTGTKNLQEQIFFKDLPLVTGAIVVKITSLLMKGRSNYICLNRYHQHFNMVSFLKPEVMEARAHIDAWLNKTKTGDRAELSWLGDDDPLWDIISSSSDRCKGAECPHRDECFIVGLRRLAAKADIIIVNHHLFFADLMLKSDGFGEIIPRFEAVVFDEAHRLEDIATSYFGTSLGSGQILDLAADLQKEMDAKGGKAPGDALLNLAALRTGTAQLNTHFATAPDKGRLDIERIEKGQRLAIDSIIKGLRYVQANFENSLSDRAHELRDNLDMIFSKGKGNWLEWYEKRKRGVVFHASPLDIAENMREQLYRDVKNIVFTSATLSTGGTFDYIRSRLGIHEDAYEAMYPSHFNFIEQVRLYIPHDLPLPNSYEFVPAITDRIAEVLKLTQGRALILFTSYHNLNSVYNTLKGLIPYRIFRQGEAPKNILLERFKKDTGSVLMATSSFWEGVDVPGETLSCLIIDKLPFDSPGDPIVAARIDMIRKGNKNPFMEYQVPSAIISLKQGLGRLIRKSTDRGILAVLDKRIIKSSYGRFFIKSLPDMRIVNDLKGLEDFFENQSEHGGTNLES